MDNTYKVLLTETALYTLEDNVRPKSGDDILDRIEIFQIFPELGTPVQNKDWENYRRLVIDDYIVYYTVDHEKRIVYIQFFKHGRMQRPH